MKLRLDISKDGPEISLDWLDVDLSSALASIKKNAEAALAKTLADPDDGVRAEWLCYEHLDDPTTITFELPFAASSGDGVMFDVSIAKLVAEGLPGLFSDHHDAEENVAYAIRARDAFIEIAAAIHRACNLGDKFPDLEYIDDVPVPEWYKQDLSDYQISEWMKYEDKKTLAQYLKPRIEHISEIIALLRSNKVAMEAVLSTCEEADAE